MLQQQQQQMQANDNVLNLLNLLCFSSSCLYDPEFKGACAKPIFVDKLGANPESMSNGMPLEDFGHGHPDPNLTYSKDLVDIMYGENGPDLGTASDGACAKPIFVDKLGANPESISNGMPLEDFGHGDPDPILTYAKDLVDSMYGENGPDLGTGSDASHPVIGIEYDIYTSLVPAIIVVTHGGRYFVKVFVDAQGGVEQGGKVLEVKPIRHMVARLNGCRT
ncbi:hypothetical protein LOK49_LG10G01580 [Camellia lanceoleosa]|uniref:Uncharacterized protein n=1 Tax=Camellia lanceoleosa TaxID=1840588 RepID=A0ACC0G6Y4_9ERIC|nr:hypothetical protein LOK49_LG10G01580 [Camellia lanceoleosa]